MERSQETTGGTPADERKEMQPAADEGPSIGERARDAFRHAREILRGTPVPHSDAQEAKAAFTRAEEEAFATRLRSLIEAGEHDAAERAIDERNRRLGRKEDWFKRFKKR